MKRARRWLAVGLVLTAVPVALLGIAEIGLRVGGYGSSGALFVATPDGDHYVTDLEFAYRYFSRDIAIRPAPAMFATKKKSDGYRVFVFGGSAGFGDFMPEYGLARVLEVLLRECHPGVNFEVVNAAVAAVNSHVLLPVVRVASGYEPDAIVIYLGNNEVVGPWGPGSIGSSTGKAAPTQSLWRIRSTLWARDLRLAQLLGRVVGSLRAWAGGRPSALVGREQGLKALIRPEDASLARTYRHYERNLGDMIDAAERAGAPVLLATVASNLRNFAPFASFHSVELDAAKVEAFERIRAEAIARQSRGDCPGALEELERAIEIEESFAHVHFQRGTCLLTLGREEEAHAEFVRARDLDQGRYRADSALNAIVRRLAGEREAVTLVDVERRFLQHDASPGGASGHELFFDHVHLTFEGNYRLARAVFDALEPMLPDWISSQRSDAPPPSLETVAAVLALTDWDLERLERLIEVRYRTLGYTPEGWRKSSDGPAFWPRRGEHGAPDPLQVYARALERTPDDLLLVRGYAALLEHRGDFAGAAEHLQRLVEKLPGVTEWRVAYGRVLLRGKRVDEAVAQLETAVGFAPDDSAARFQLANALVANGRAEDARTEYERVLAVRQGDPLVLFRLGRLHLRRGENESAAEHFQTALRRAPGDAELHNGLGVALVRLGRIESGVAHLQKAVQINPANADARANLERTLQRARPRAAPR